MAQTSPATHKPIDPKRVQDLLVKEWEKFEKTYPESGKHNKRASKSLPLGVTSSFQHWDPYPITIVSGRGAYLKDVDGRKLLDLSMGFGAMLVGHLNPKVIRAVRKALRKTEPSLLPRPPSLRRRLSASRSALVLTYFDLRTREPSPRCMPSEQLVL